MMEYIFGERQSGKTFELIKRAVEYKGSVILVPNRTMLDSTMLAFREMMKNKDIPVDSELRVEVFEHFITTQILGRPIDRHASPRYVFVDELELCLKTIINKYDTYELSSASVSLGSTKIVKLEYSEHHKDNVIDFFSDIY